MMQHASLISAMVWARIGVMAAVTFLIRVLPLTAIRGRVRSRFLRSFLYYVPYATLAVMTFPAILHATSSVAAGGIAFLVGILLTWRGLGLVPTAAVCCLSVLVVSVFF